ncbi:MAG: ComEC/Rec2 family competence protein [Opitutaceae bacterium]|nr:ComEC/Rec2 family competence protein [Opitutaceae bacterium]
MPSPARHHRAPLLWLLLPFLGGLVGAWHWSLPAAGAGPLVAAAGALALAAGFLARGRSRLALAAWGGGLACSAGLTGFAYLHLRHPRLHEGDLRPPRDATLVVEVRQRFAVRPGARSLAGTGVVVAAGRAHPDLVGQRIAFSALRRGGVVPARSGRYVMRGVAEPLARGADRTGFDDYLASLGVRQRLTRARVVREVAPPAAWARLSEQVAGHCARILQRGLEHRPAAASVYRAMLLGERAELTPEQERAFMRSGTFHVFSISGLHVGVIALALQQLFRLLRVPPRRAVAGCLLLLGGYVHLTGASPPAVRALLMVAFLLAARAFRLPGNALAALAASALACLLLDPLQLFGAGFQMSYAVVTALIVMGAPLAERWNLAWQPYGWLPRPDWRWRHHLVDWTRRRLLAGLAAGGAAFLASTPPGIGNFGLLSPGSLLANLCIVPLSSLAIIAGLLSLFAGLAGAEALSTVFNAAAGLLIVTMDAALRAYAEWPGVCFDVRARAAWLPEAALALLLATMLAGRGLGWTRRGGGFWPPVAVVVLLVALGTTRP